MEWLIRPGTAIYYSKLTGATMASYGLHYGGSANPGLTPARHYIGAAPPADALNHPHDEHDCGFVFAPSIV
jgi:hypothetical protein